MGYEVEIIIEEAPNFLVMDKASYNQMMKEWQEREEMRAMIRSLIFYVEVLAENEEKQGFKETADDLRDLIAKARLVAGLGDNGSTKTTDRAAGVSLPIFEES